MRLWLFTDSFMLFFLVYYRVSFRRKKKEDNPAKKEESKGPVGKKEEKQVCMRICCVLSFLGATEERSALSGSQKLML